MKKILIPTILLILVLMYGCASTQTARQPAPAVPAYAAPQAAPAAPEVQTPEATPPAAPEPVATTAPASASIDLKDFSFQPETVIIRVGGTVTWTQRDSVGHTVTSYDGTFDSPILANGETWSHTFDKAGTYTYHCSPHPRMTGTIIVK